MTMRSVVVSFAVATIVACSSTDDGGASPCADISGNYTVTATRASGTCDASLDPAGDTSISFAKEGADWVAKMPAIQGGCPGTLNATTCKFSSSCEAKDKDGNVIATAQLEYTFTASGYTGSSITGLRPPSVATACDVTYRETAKKL